MMRQTLPKFYGGKSMTENIDSKSLRMAWSLAPWDEAVCNYPVIQITKIQVLGPDAKTDIGQFELARERLDAGLVSCRLSHECLTESMLLEDLGFRFIEMIYTPELDLTGFNSFNQAGLLRPRLANTGDLPEVLEIARTAFHSERFKMDPRLEPSFSEQRFQNWVASSQQLSKQVLYLFSDDSRIIAFFVIEALSDGTCYWHLNAVAPAVQGKGFGRRVWLSMLNLAAKSGAKRVRTSISARNHRVLNLYARLGFTFFPPLMTFHWVRKNFV